MIKFKQLFIAAGVASLTACAPRPLPPVNITTVFDAEQAKNLSKVGTNTIRGSALMRQVNGGINTCAGQPVLLIPATIHAQKRMKILFGNATKAMRPVGREVVIKGSPPEYFKLTRNTTCDAQGRFVFDKVTDGSFYIATNVVWSSFGFFYRTPQGGTLMEKVTVGENEIKEIVLSP
jgi:hypothetical protein